MKKSWLFRVYYKVVWGLQVTITRIPIKQPGWLNGKEGTPRFFLIRGKLTCWIDLPKDSTWESSEEKRDLLFDLEEAEEAKRPKKSEKGDGGRDSRGKDGKGKGKGGKGKRDGKDKGKDRGKDRGGKDRGKKGGKSSGKNR